MSDRTISIANFKYGLDTRREALASLPGTLEVLQNAHINSGGEVDKRKAFVLLSATQFDANTFGLQDTDSGLMTFGSKASLTVPPGVTYQRLISPLGASDDMVLVACSCSFLGKAVVIAEYLSGINALFYNGVLVAQVTDGLVILTALSSIATVLAGIVNRALGPDDLGTLGWLADANKTSSVASDSAGYHETTLNGSVLVMSPIGVHFTPTVNNNSSAAGVIGFKLIDQNYTGVPGQAASRTFTLTSAGVNTGDTIDVQAPYPNSGSSNATLTGGPITFDTSLTQTATDIITAINNNTFLTGYSARSDGGVIITVYAPVSYGNFTGNLHIITTGNLTTTNAGGQQTGLTLSLSGNFDYIAVKKTNSNVVTTIIAALTTGFAVSTVSAPANYTASVITLTVVQGGLYTWTPGAHEVSLVNGTDPPITSAGTFFAQGTTVTVNGSGASVTYTGVLQFTGPSITWTALTPTGGNIDSDIIFTSNNHLTGPSQSPVIGANCAFKSQIPLNTFISRQFRCTATDGITIAVRDFSITLELDSPE